LELDDGEDKKRRGREVDDGEEMELRLGMEVH
jgi:hypothetical protein